MSAEAANNQDRSPSRGSKTLCIPFESEERYRRCLEETSACREHMESIAQRHLELFPPGFEQGFIFKGTDHSKKQDIDLRRIKLEATGDTFQLRPSFLMPYMFGRTDELDRALYLRQWGVPYVVADEKHTRLKGEKVYVERLVAAVSGDHRTAVLPPGSSSPWPTTSSSPTGPRTPSTAS